MPMPIWQKPLDQCQRTINYTQHISEFCKSGNKGKCISKIFISLTFLNNIKGIYRYIAFHVRYKIWDKFTVNILWKEKWTHSFFRK